MIMGSILSHELVLKAVEVEHDLKAVNCHRSGYFGGDQRQIQSWTLGGAVPRGDKEGKSTIQLQLRWQIFDKIG